MTLEVGQHFPEFALPNQDNKTVRLEDFAGQWLVLYIYPRDDTPGCTIQGKSFTASKQDFDEVNTTVVGVSADDVDSHKAFCSKFSFTIDLLADPEQKLLNATGVGTRDFNGLKFWNRSSFIIDPNGIVRKVYENVKPDGHELELLKDIKELQSQSS